MKSYEQSEPVEPYSGDKQIEFYSDHYEHEEVKKEKGIWLNILLFILTFISTTLAGVYWLNLDPYHLEYFPLGLDDAHHDQHQRNPDQRQLVLLRPKDEKGLRQACQREQRGQDTENGLHGRTPSGVVSGRAPRCARRTSSRRACA